MIQCNELRTGNFVLIDNNVEKLTLINNDPGFADVPLIGFQGGTDNYKSCNSEGVHPVPLTDDILRRCGFSFHEHFHLWQFFSGDTKGLSGMDIDTDYNLIDFMRRPIVKKMTSLHQLQNIFYALKGTEIGFTTAGGEKLQEKASMQVESLRA